MSKATIYPIVPEVCEFCDDGLAWMTCHDGKFRCRKCVHAYAKNEGWDTIPDRLKHEEKKVMPVMAVEQNEPEDNSHFQPKMF